MNTVSGNKTVKLNKDLQNIIIKQLEKEQF